MNQTWPVSARYYILSLILIMLALVLWQIRELFKPLITAGLIAYIFYPVVGLLHTRFKITRKTASRIVYFLILGLIITLPIIFAPTLSGELQEIVKDLVVLLDQVGLVLARPISVGGIDLHLG